MITPSDNPSAGDMEQGRKYKVRGVDCCLEVTFVSTFTGYFQSEDNTVEKHTAAFENGVVIGNLWGGWNIEEIVE